MSLNGTNLDNRVRRGERLKRSIESIFSTTRRDQFFPLPFGNAIVAPYTRLWLIYLGGTPLNGGSFQSRSTRGEKKSRTIDRRNIFCSVPTGIVTVNFGVIPYNARSILFPAHENRRPVVRAIASCVVFSDSEQQR